MQIMLYFTSILLTCALAGFLAWHAWRQQRVRYDRRQAEAAQALQNSHALLAATLESTADGLLVVDRAGKVTSFNRKFLELWRIPESLAATRDDEQLLQFVLAQLQYPDAFLAKVQRLYQTPDASDIDELAFKDGRVFERYSQPQYLGDAIVGRVWSFRDITERKRQETEILAVQAELRAALEAANQSRRALLSVIEDYRRAEEALRALSGRYEAILAAVPDIIMEVDHNRVYTWANQAGLEFFGTDVLGREAAAYFESEQDTYGAVQPLFNGGEGVIYVESWQRRQDGEKRLLAWWCRALEDERGNVTGALSTAHDITERKRLQEELAWEQYLLNALLENVPDHIYFKDTTSRFIRISRALARAFGLSDPAEAVGKTDFDFFGEGHARQAYEDEQRIMVTGRSLNKEERETWPDRPDTWVLTTKMPLRDKEGSIIGTFGISKDITERKWAEEALRAYSERLEGMVAERTRSLEQAQAQLVQQERMATLGHLASGLAHELRNPLGAIKNAAYLLNMVLESPAFEVGEALDVLRQEVDTSERIVNGLLDFASPHAPAFQVVEINRLVREAVVRIPPAAMVEGGAKVSIECALDDCLPLIPADPRQVGQVFDRLLLNAVQAMASPLCVNRAEGRLTVTTRSDGAEWVVVTFQDTGVGIPAENLGRLFEPLFTTKAKGMGLGLAFARMLVENHRGHVSVESRVGQGSTFSVHLPVVREDL